MSENKEQDLIMNLEYLLTGAEMASCDARTSNVIGIPSLVLMERAALSVADSVDVFLRKKFSGAGRGRRPVVLAAAGRGNNGADALAAGRILLDRGWDVRFCRLSGKISPDSSFAVQENILRQYGKEVVEYPDSLLSKVLKHQDLTSKALTNTAFSMEEPAAAVPDLIIDGLFGTGLSRDLSGQAAECVEAINFCRDRFGSYVLAVDIPSGISSDDGSVMGCAVRCDETATFAFYKRGHFLHPGTVYAGVCHLAQIGITWRAFEKMPSMFTLMDAEAADLLPVRDPGGNKGTFGKVLIAAGRRNMCGAALLAARACMAAGAGMVRIFTHEANRLIIQQAIPEALLDTFTDEETPARAVAKLRASLDWADIAAAGPAMGTDDMAAALLCEILEYVQADGSGRPLRGLVLDADALRLLAKDDALCSLLAGRQSEIPCILTPHMAEFAALAGRSVPECIADRAHLVQILRYGGDGSDQRIVRHKGVICLLVFVELRIGQKAIVRLHIPIPLRRSERLQAEEEGAPLLEHRAGIIGFQSEQASGLMEEGDHLPYSSGLQPPLRTPRYQFRQAQTYIGRQRGLRYLLQQLSILVSSIVVNQCLDQRNI